MKNLQTVTDKTAISLSLLCASHCLALPFILVVFPSIAALQLNSEAFHLWMIFAVIPISIFALTLGCKQHKRLHLVAVGLCGLACLLAAIAVEPLFGEIAEKTLTVLGAGIISYGHYRNYRLCQAHKSCACPENKDASTKQAV